MPHPIIEVSGLGKRFGGFVALEGIDLGQNLPTDWASAPRLPENAGTFAGSGAGRLLVEGAKDYAIFLLESAAQTPYSPPPF